MIRYFTAVFFILGSHKKCKTLPKNIFTDSGYEIVDNFLSVEECNFIKEHFDNFLSSGYSCNTAGIRPEKTPFIATYHNNTEIRLKHYDLLHPEITEIIKQRLRPLLYERLGQYPDFYAVSLHRDVADPEGKRPFHNDGFRLNFKAFIYLTDVLCTEEGAYTIIPKSHHHCFRKCFNLLYNALRLSKEYDDMKYLYRDSDGVPLTGKKGTLILSIQQAAHKRAQTHSSGTRDTMIFYASLPKMRYGQSSLSPDV